MPELIMPIVGLGLALATVENVAWRWMLLSLVAGLALGFAIPFTAPDGFDLSAMYIAIGTLLICANSWVQRLIVPTAFFAGGYIGHTESLATSINLQDILLQAASLVLVSVAVAFSRKHYRTWFAIPRRIGGSWLLAAGCMLLAVLIRAPDMPIVVSAPQPSHLDDPNQPHIHGANGEIIYLPTDKAEEPSSVPKKPDLIEGMTGKKIEP
jgi:hypothetical protein